MSADLTTEAVAALRLAAERLGVDPFRLARFLGDGRLGDILELMGRPGNSGEETRRLVDLAEDYLKFLDGEIEIQNERRPPIRKNGG